MTIDVMLGIYKMNVIASVKRRENGLSNDKEYEDIQIIFKDIIKKFIKEAIERAGKDITVDVMGMGNAHQYRLNLLRELGLEDEDE